MVNVLLRASYPTDTETLIEEVEANADKVIIKDTKFLVLINILGGF